MEGIKVSVQLQLQYMYSDSIQKEWAQTILELNLKWEPRLLIFKVIAFGKLIYMIVLIMLLYLMGACG